MRREAQESRPAPVLDGRVVRIATVYSRRPDDAASQYHMSQTRWRRMSEALAALGYAVDMVAARDDGAVELAPNLRYVPYAEVQWQEYDVIKTLFHRGFDSVRDAGQDDHPFIISKLGSVVGRRDDIEGVYFFNHERVELYETQRAIRARSRYVSILTEPSKRLWQSEFGDRDNILLVPTGVDRTIPPPAHNPYAAFAEPIAVYVGNIYAGAQAEVNLLWKQRLNAVGALLKRKGIRLCFVGTGNVDGLDPDAVTNLGAVPNEQIWDYQYYARAGIVLAQGPVQHNESSKLYYYLRSGLPVVSETPVPNNDLLDTTGMGYTADYGDDRMFAEMIEGAITARWPREEAMAYMVRHHTWDLRAQLYDRIIRRDLGLPAPEAVEPP